ncbi:DsbA family oxidoreductase [Alteracholeplasma palmae J233]|uniref:DsbA family oxidoreductase n=1 Tax=Alteracholeplasma palmae (strain ATCC 49389 / J233) TaxID=1318466 RepID=U4KL01_ALTPJ|nr:DsbA family oxidoreductase [Alteracholeplasma palmae]CCV64402.1 DsbA family oxidoreductase [Alteracholeplasma palmae J233]
MKIEIWSDFACPFCYIGKNRLEIALKEIPSKDVDITYKAYELNPIAPLETTESSVEVFRKLKNTSVESAKQMFNRITQMGALDGLTFKMDDIIMTKTFDGHRLAKWARKFNKEADLTKRLMKAYFEDGLNLANYDVLTQLAEEVGLDKQTARKVLDSNEYEDTVNQEILEARQLGVQGVPFFVINRKYAISGAQSLEQFKEILKDAYKEENSFEIKGDDSGLCTDGNCDI